MIRAVDACCNAVWQVKQPEARGKDCDELFKSALRADGYVVIACATLEAVTAALTKALCNHPSGPSDINSCCPQPMGGKRCQTQVLKLLEDVK